MTKLIMIVSSTIGSSLGWWAGARIGFMTAFMVSIVGFGVGIYMARRFVQSYEL